MEIINQNLPITIIVNIHYGQFRQVSGKNGGSGLVSVLEKWPIHRLKGEKLHASYITTTTITTILWPFVRDYPSEPVPEETFTHSHLS